MNLKFKVNVDNGFTLVEVIVAMAILMLIIGAFLSLFSTSLFGIYGAGDKGVAYSEAQADLETRMASVEAEELDENDSNLIISFPGIDPIEIPGGLVASEQLEGTRTSTLETFLPMAPIIRVTPASLTEGFKYPLADDFEITGTNTNFDATATSIGILDRFGTTILFTPTVTVTGPETAFFNLTNPLINAQGEYIVRVETTLESGEVERARAKITVDQPRFIAAGDHALYVSATGQFWLERSGNLFTDFPTYSAINGITFGGGRFIAAGDSGKIFVSGNQVGWAVYNIGGSQINFHDVAWVNDLGRYIVVGDGGAIYSSTNGITWTSLYSGTTEDLSGIDSATDDYGTTIIIVGTGGTIIKSTDGSSFSTARSGTEEEIFNSAAAYFNGSNLYFAAVGNNGLIYSSADGDNWTNRSLAESINLYDITYSRGVAPAFVAVGANGTVARSSNLENWAISTLDPNVDLTGAAFGYGNQFIAVGSDSLYLSEDAVTWSPPTEGVPLEAFRTIGAR